MITSERCTICESKHHNRYICSKCGKSLGAMYPYDVDWKCCPYCGEMLYPDGLDHEQRIEYANRLYHGYIPTSESR